MFRPLASAMKVDNRRKYQMMSLGILCNLHMVLCGVGLEPLSPFLLQLVIDGTAAFNYDKKFIGTVSEQALALVSILNQPLSNLHEYLVLSDFPEPVRTSVFCLSSFSY